MYGQFCMIHKETDTVLAYELYHEEGFTIERIAKLVKMDQKIVEEWLLQK